MAVGDHDVSTLTQVSSVVSTSHPGIDIGGAHSGIN
jgi:hypothetical protein